MEDQPFSNRELKAMFSRIDEKLDSIVSQTTRTNGRVLKLEDEMDGVKLKQENLAVKVGGGVLIVTVLVSVFLNRIL